MDSVKLVAAIDVGSNAVRMIIAQITNSAEINIIEDVRKATKIGKDTFSKGRISVETIDAVCQILYDFKSLMDEYNIKEYRIAATSGINEADNKDYVIEQIRSRTGFIVEGINNSQQRFYTYKALGYIDEAYKCLREVSDTLIIDIGAGGVEISLYSNGLLCFTDYVKIGSLRLTQILSELEKETVDFPIIIEEFIESKIYLLYNKLKKFNIKGYIGLGGEMRTLLQLCNKTVDSSVNYITGKQINEIYNNIRVMTADQIISEYNISRRKASMLLPSVIIFNKFLQATNANTIITPMVSLRHGLVADMADEWLKSSRRDAFINDIISSANYIGRQYEYDKEHAEHVVNLSLLIFDEIQDIIKLSKTERLYLRLAAILHDVGKYVNLDAHDVHSYNIISSLDMIGLSSRELKLIACVVKYHSDLNPSVYDENYMEWSLPERMIISKLSAILKLADSLDLSHKQKITDVEFARKGKELNFIVKSRHDVLLEKWRFGLQSKYFEEVTGVKSILIQEGVSR